MRILLRSYRSYRSIIVGLVLLFALLAARMLWHGNLRFLFLPWNVFLAALPLVFAHACVSARYPIVRWCFAALWLLLFPNSAYLLTDIVHLDVRDGVSFWLDLVLLFGGGMYGVVLGFRSLRLMEGWWRRHLSPRASVILTLGILCASGYGIYLGRVERWNSWDLLVNPGDLLLSVLYELRHPIRCFEVWALSGIFSVALGLGYFAQRR